MSGLICIKCGHPVFLDPKKEICYKTGGLYCKKLKAIVGKYDPCRAVKKGRKKGVTNDRASPLFFRSGKEAG